MLWGAVHDRQAATVQKVTFPGKPGRSSRVRLCSTATTHIGTGLLQASTRPRGRSTLETPAYASSTSGLAMYPRNVVRRSSDRGSMKAGCGMRKLNDRFRIWDCGFRILCLAAGLARRARVRDRHIALPQIRNPKSKIRNAFTLVEMLVAVGVVVVMMTLFATIFQMATAAMQKQKGLSENDQRVRLVSTMLRNDLRTNTPDPATGMQVQTRTFRWLVPIAPSDATILPAIPPGSTINATNDRKGYFYISMRLHQ